MRTAHGVIPNFRLVKFSKIRIGWTPVDSAGKVATGDGSFRCAQLISLARSGRQEEWIMSNGAPLPGIEHVIVLMLENRSFDNVLGGLYPKKTEQKLYRGLLGTESNPVDPKKGRPSVVVFQGPPDQTTRTMPYPDPGELYTDMMEQIFGSENVPPGGKPVPMSGFAWNYRQQKPSYDGVPPDPRRIMQYYSDLTMPTSAYLASQYAVCDCWFASGPVQTLANRVFTHCGTPSKLPNQNRSRVDNPDFTPNWYDPLTPPVTDTTIFELLDDANTGGTAPECSDIYDPTKVLNWKVYYHDAPLSALCDYVHNRWCLDYLYGGNVWGFEYYDKYERGFAYDVANGLLPTYSFIEPRYTNHSDDPLWGPSPNSNHPGGAGVDWEDPNGQSLPPPIDVSQGEGFLSTVYSILLENPAVFDKTLLIVTYDEHGGTYDHVPPPTAISPFPEPVVNFNYDRYGVRVPTIFINPRIKPGTIYPPRKAGGKIPDPPFDHTSILSTLTAQFGLRPYRLSLRVDSAPQLTGLIPAARVAYERPPLARPEVPAAIQQSRIPRGRPRPLPQAHTLAGALGPLYQRIERSRRFRR
jgi:phospholipase C